MNLQQAFNKNDAFPNGLSKSEFEQCTFNQVDWAEEDLRESVFIDCEITDSNLSLIKTHKTAFRNVIFKNCKMLGVHFENCNPFLFHVEFEDCNLDLSCFYQTTLQNARFINCNLSGVDFEESNLKGSRIQNCNMDNAIFMQTNVESCNFHQSYNLDLNPEQNQIKAAHFDLNQLPSLLARYQINMNK